MTYTLVKNADTGIVARTTINSNFEKLFNTGLIACNLTTQFTQSISTTESKINLVDTIIAISSDIFEFDVVNKKIKVLKTGLYSFSGNTTFETTNANERVEFILYKNGVATNVRGYVVSSGSGKKNTIGYQGYLSLTANDLLEFYVKVESGTTSLTAYYANIGLDKKVF